MYFQEYTDEQVAIMNAERDGRLAVVRDLEILMERWDYLNASTREEFLRAIIDIHKH